MSTVAALLARARAMGVERMQIHRWLKRFALAIEAYRNPDETDA